MSQVDIDAHTVIMKIALGWSLFTTIFLILIAILLDVFGIRRLDRQFRIWIYGTFLVGLLGGLGAWFTNFIKLDVTKAAVAVSPDALDKAVDQVYTAPRTTTSVAEADSSSVDRAKYKIYIQFAGVIRRDDVIALGNKLSQTGWKVQGKSRGGERTTASAGYNEIRYSGNGEAAAKLLASEIQADNIVSNRITYVRNNNVAPDVLEAWISR